MEPEESFMNYLDFDCVVQLEQAQEIKESTAMVLPPVPNKRGRKPGKKTSEKMDIQAKQEKSRQSARECRTRKKLRYQYLEELIAEHETAIVTLRQELRKYAGWCVEIDNGRTPEGFAEFLEEITKPAEPNSARGANM